LLLALGFPFETTTAITRLILGGTFDRFPGLKVMVAHSGGALPYLAGRLDACVGDHLDPNIRLKQEASAYLRMMYFDAISYSVPTLELLISLVGVERLMFGTDHPFFPPAVPNAELEATAWHSPVAHRPVLAALGETAATAILRDNARRILGLP
jgi:predicted TIM-barrel fold metal-dependent hydrolase